MFQPEYREIGEKVSDLSFFVFFVCRPYIYMYTVEEVSVLTLEYFGFLSKRFVGLHAISLMAVYEDENGEKYILGRASHGDDFGDHG